MQKLRPQNKLQDLWFTKVSQLSFLSLFFPTFDVKGGCNKKFWAEAVPSYKEDPEPWNMSQTPLLGGHNSSWSLIHLLIRPLANDRNSVLLSCIFWGWPQSGDGGFSYIIYTDVYASPCLLLHLLLHLSFLVIVGVTPFFFWFLPAFAHCTVNASLDQ